MFEEIADRLERSRAAWIIAAIFIFQCLIFVPVATVRPIDGDEGFYLLAAKLVFQGKQPYTDFFYPQMPLLPYVYGLWMWLFGFSWYAARLLSALLAVGTGLLLYKYVVSLTSKRRLGLLAVSLYALCAVLLGWYTVAKTYSLSVFLLMSAVVLLPGKSDSHRELRYILSGLLLGLAIDTRLFFLAVVPVFLLVLRRNEESKPEAYIKSQGWLLLGVLIGLLPNLWFLAVSPDTYIFSNIGYHAMRTGGGLLGFLEQKLLIILELIGAWKAWGHVSLQLPILLFANCYYLLLAWRLGKRLSFAFYVAAVLCAISLLATPTFVQYFCVVVPFLIVNSLLVIHWLDEAVCGSTARASLGLLGVLVVVAYVLVAPVGVEQFLAPPSPDPLTGEGGGEWDIETNRIIAAHIDACTDPGEPVMTWWPGYLLESDASILPKMENHFGLRVANRLTSRQLDQYRIISESEIEAHLQAGSTRVVVLGNWVNRPSKVRYRQLLGESGYGLTRKIGETELYIRLR